MPTPNLDYFGTFEDTVQELKENVPLPYKVNVRRTKVPGGRAADCELQKKGKWRFLIRIDRELEENAAVLTLIHEWAHALAWNTAYDQGLMEDHGPEWGVAYARIWQKLFRTS